MRSALILASCCCLLPAQEPDPRPELRPPGVSAKIEQAIQRGLQYLARNQSKDGSWRQAGNYGDYPAAMTALAGTALACSGSTPTRGPYWLPVRKATDYLLRTARPDGLIADPSEDARSMYGHGFSMLYLGQIYGMEEDAKRQEKLHQILSKAVELTGRSQSRQGGWLYTPTSTGDEGSVTVTQIQGLRACRNGGIAVPQKIIDEAVGYIRKSANPDGSIRYNVSRGGGGRPAITAAAVAVLYNAGRYDDPLAEKALKYAVRTLPVSGSRNGHHFYAHLYLAQALYQRGGKDWDDYYQRMAAWLLTRQKRDGSWDGDGVGTTYGTALALIILQLPYAYLPIYQR